MWQKVLSHIEVLLVQGSISTHKHTHLHWHQDYMWVITCRSFKKNMLYVYHVFSFVTLCMWPFVSCCDQSWVRISVCACPGNSSLSSFTASLDCGHSLLNHRPVLVGCVVDSGAQVWRWLRVKLRGNRGYSSPLSVHVCKIDFLCLLSVLNVPLKARGAQTLINARQTYKCCVYVYRIVCTYNHREPVDKE